MSDIQTLKEENQRLRDAIYKEITNLNEDIFLSGGGFFKDLNQKLKDRSLALREAIKETKNIKNQNVWEDVSEYSSNGNLKTQRLPVPGGWLYAITDNVRSVSVVFVASPSMRIWPNGGGGGHTNKSFD